MINKHNIKAVLILMLAISAVGCTETVEQIDESDYIAVDASVAGTQPTTETITEPSTETPTQPPTEPIEMPSDYKLSGACILDVPTILQKPELPTGCEVTALATALNYCGFSIDKVELCDNFLPIDLNGEYTFEEKYIGNPKADNGFGCYAPVIVETAESYFKAVGAEWKALNLTGAEFDELFYQIEKGRPVVVWASMSLKDVTFRLRWTTADGDEAWFAELEHCMVLKGYDEANDIVYVCDPLKGDMEYSLERFRNVYDQMGKQAVIIYEQEN